MSERICYVVTIDGPEGSEIAHVCLSEETAKKKFIETRDSLVEEAKERVEHHIKRKHDQDTINYYRKQLEELKELTWPDTHDMGGTWIHRWPWIREYVLLE